MANSNLAAIAADDPQFTTLTFCCFLVCFIGEACKSGAYLLHWHLFTSTEVGKLGDHTDKEDPPELSSADGAQFYPW